MTRKLAQRLSILLAVLAAMFGGLTLVAFAQDDDADTMESSEPVDQSVDEQGEVEVAIEPTGDNGYCTICHNQPERTIRLEDGTLLNLYVSPELLASSVHGPSEDSPGLGCLDCHGEDAFPHSGLPPADGRVYTIDSNAMCTSCHENYGEELEMGLHAQAISNGNLNAAVCTDCHGAHHVQTAEFRPEIVADSCGDCHETTLAEWKMSAHVDIGPLGCGSCHNFHAQTLRVGETTTDLCLNCHEGNMPPLYVHETHITAVEGGENPVECADCHMYTGDANALVSTGGEMNTGHSMLLDATPCNTCHTNLVESGEWDAIVSARVAEIDTMPAEIVDTDPPEEAHNEEAEAESQQGVRFAIQGLLLGLGLGITFTIVFVTRSRRES